MTSPLALTVAEVKEAVAGAIDGSQLRFSTLTDRLNALQESKRQSYMSTDKARAEYDDDLKVST